jgi:hypothetical protein
MYLFILKRSILYTLARQIGDSLTYGISHPGTGMSRPGQAVEVECGCVLVNICMNNRALRAVKKLYICLCAARDRVRDPLFQLSHINPRSGLLT